MQHRTGEPPEPSLFASLRVLYATARAALAGGPVTGRRWRRPPEVCPPWCAQDHTCTASRRELRGPQAEHRSPLTTWRPDYGSLVATRVQGLDGSARLELRVQVRLDAAGDRALAQGIHLPLAVNLAIRTTLAQIAAAFRTRELEGWPDHAELAGRRQLPRSSA